MVSLIAIRQAGSLEACFFHISLSEPTVFSKSDAVFVSSTSLIANRRVRHSSAVSDCKQSSSTVLIRGLFAAGGAFSTMLARSGFSSCFVSTKLGGL